MVKRKYVRTAAWYAAHTKKNVKVVEGKKPLFVLRVDKTKPSEKFKEALGVGLAAFACLMMCAASAFSMSVFGYLGLKGLLFRPSLSFLVMVVCFIMTTFFGFLYYAVQIPKLRNETKLL